MLKLWKSASLQGTHEELFVARYQHLLNWALQLTSGNRTLAEDLVHNAFIQFTLAAPDLGNIQNLDGYLYGVLRFLHLSQMRRASRSRLQQLSIVDYDSAETGLRTVSPPEQIEAQDELRLVCEYACLRKESSKAGSVLILRFFHGYYPSEIVRILRSSRQVVEKRLEAARREAKLFLAEPGRLSFLKDVPRPQPLPSQLARSTDELLRDLRRAIFQSCREACLTSAQFQVLYQKNISEPVEAKQLAHIVSCQTCLEKVNTILGLPSLASRCATDSLGKEKSREPGSQGRPPEAGSGGGSAVGDEPIARLIRNSKERSKEVFEHRPKELHIAVNGYIQASQKINSEVSEQTVDLNQGEEVHFVEVFSEQDVRLLLFTLDDPPPPSGPYQQSRRIDFSDDRSLEAIFSFANPWPTLHLIYQDPLLRPLPAAGEAEMKPAAEAEAGAPGPNDRTLMTRVRSRISSIISGFDRGILLQPATLTAIVALVLIAGLLMLSLRRPAAPISAASLLDRAAAAELDLAHPDTALHQTITLEERAVCEGCGNQPISNWRIEVWESPAKSIIARRLFDQRGALVAGDWRRADGVQTLYHHGVRPQLQIHRPQLSVRSFDHVWHLALSARDFSALVERRTTRVDELPDTYVITFDSGTSSSPVVSARLVLKRDDLHPLEQVLVIRHGDTVRSYTFKEAGLEHKGTDRITPSVFDPDPQLLFSTPTGVRSTLSDAAVPSTPVAPAVGASASTELEVQVLSLLQGAGADLGEQVSVARTPQGQLEVTGIVETDERKRELLRALEPVTKNPAVTIQVRSAREAQEQSPATRASNPIIVDQVDTGPDTIPVESELRRYFLSTGLSEDQAAASARRFANRVLTQSSQALQHAWAIKRLTERFSPEELRQLSPEARTNWLAMIRGHCRALQHMNAALRQELRPIFFPAAGSDQSEAGIQITDDRELVRTAERLLGICTSNHKLMSSAFTVSAVGTAGAAIGVPQFFQSLINAELLAARIARVR